ncbi:MAG: trypsin-like peptidase domain-containing protein [Sphingopyxis sp.]|nr:trypsin-like peptidase domain-containing protein [Sphingopyxis sp.]
MLRLLALICVLVGFAVPARAADDVGAAARGVVRVVTVAMVDGEVVGFGHGSGVAVSPTRIVTNAHVVDSAVRYPANVAVGVVPSEGQKSYAARLIAVDAKRDLALIELTEGRIPAAAIFTGPVTAGMDVVALGYPGNVDLASARTAQDYILPRAPVRSEGDVSAFQAVQGVATLLHTANIARGNSGGPLVDGCGRVIGINSFLTRADEGDAGFAFAVASRELTAFLADSRQSYNGVGTGCITLAEAEARDRAAAEAEAKAASAANADREAASAQELKQQERAAAEAALTARENRLALAGLALVLAAMASGAGWVWAREGDSKARFGMGAGALLALGAIALFVTRPSLVAATPEVATIAESGPELVTAAPLGKRICTLRPDRSRITVSKADDVELTLSGSGCAGGGAQFAPGADGGWTRATVAGDTAAASIATLSADGATYRVERWLPDSEALAKLRDLQGGAAARCTSDPATLEQLSATQAGIRAALSEAPNERLVYECAGVGN